MLVLDEAQNLKNADTKRAKLARARREIPRRPDGTPIENYLDELWSLFNTINPGLLVRARASSAVSPVHRRDRKPAARRASRADRPFILRRTKNAVLSELPPCTD